MSSETCATATTAPKAHEERFFSRVIGNGIANQNQEPAQTHAEKVARILLARKNPDFRPRREQLDCIDASLKQRHVLAQMPTGMGKSLVFQALSQEGRMVNGSGDVLLISPSTALSDSQVADARLVGLRSYATHGKMQASDRKEAIRAWSTGRCDLLAISPEALDVEGSQLLSALYSSRPPFRIVLDEAHLYQDWGLGFRPAYRSLRANLERVYADLLHSIPWVLLSATLRASAESDLVRNLKLGERLFRYRGSVLRTNIRMRLVEIPSDVSHDRASVILRKIIRPERDKTAIVYAQYASDTEKLYKIMTRNWPRPVTRYHAKQRPSEDRPDGWQQEQGAKFAGGKAQTMIATVAYGMGIDLPSEVRSVVLLGPPTSIAEMVQMAGRCGRKGSDSAAYILYSPALLKKQQVLVEGSWPDPAFLLEVLKNYAQKSNKNAKEKYTVSERDESHVNEVGNLMPGGGKMEERSAVDHLLGMGLLYEDRKSRSWRNNPIDAPPQLLVAPDAREKMDWRIENYRAHRNDAIKDAAAMRSFVDRVARGECAQAEILKAFDDSVQGKCREVGALLCSSCERPSPDVSTGAEAKGI